MIRCSSVESWSHSYARVLKVPSALPDSAVKRTRPNRNTTSENDPISYPQFISASPKLGFRIMFSSTCCTSLANSRMPYLSGVANNQPFTQPPE